MEKQLSGINETFTRWRGSEWEQCISLWIQSIHHDFHEEVINSTDYDGIQGKFKFKIVEG